MPPGVARRFRGNSLSASVVRPIANLMLPPNPTQIRVRAGAAAGLRLVIYPRAEKYYWSGLYEPQVQAMIAQHLPRGSVFWDVGAHIGFMSAIAARTVGPAGQVIAFEPLPENVARLRKTFEVNQVVNASIREVAVSSSVGTSKFYVHSSSLMGGLIGADRARRIDVATTTLDAEMRLSRPPALLKIDVEGHENEVIAGGQRLFSDVRPILIIELLTDAAIARTHALLRHYAFRRIDDRNFIGHPSP